MTFNHQPFSQKVSLKMCGKALYTSVKIKNYLDRSGASIFVFLHVFKTRAD